MNKISINCEQLKDLYHTAILNETLDAFGLLAVEWAQKAAAEIDHLRAEVESLKPDAERWRFSVYWNRVDPTKLPPVGDFIHEDEVNEAVDRAIAALRSEGE